ncbi:hypothetical protein CRYUN_Cryun05aG0134500 [Craigia yunnanensis]
MEEMYFSKFNAVDDSRPLDFYSPLDGFLIHIIDVEPSSVTSGGWLEDTSLVEKYSISEDEYNKRSSTLRKFKGKMVSQSPSAFRNKESIFYYIYVYIFDVGQLHGRPLCKYSRLDLGDRCEVEPREKRGVVKYVARAEALGPLARLLDRSSGLIRKTIMVKGTQYFQCPSPCGAMVRPDKVKVDTSYNEAFRCFNKINYRSLPLTLGKLLTH